LQIEHLEYKNHTLDHLDFIGVCEHFERDMHKLECILRNRGMKSFFDLNIHLMKSNKNIKVDIPIWFYSFFKRDFEFYEKVCIDNNK